MLLLTSLVEDSLDQGYARAAARRRAGAGPAAGRHLVLAVGLLVVGLLLATAAAQTRARSSTVAEADAALVAEIQDRQAANDRRESRLERVRATVSRQRRAALELTEEGAALSAQLIRLESAAGAGAVEGPGMVLRLEDAPNQEDAADVDPRSSADTDGRVTDRDLQTIVNEVWAAGAEAVSVNDQRLTSLSAIRSAGEAILVDFRPLVPPYVVSAVGPPQLRPRLLAGFGGSYLDVLGDYGITYTVEDRDRLVLPASAGVTLRHATTPPARAQ